MSLVEPTKQSGSKVVNNNKDVQISVVKDRKIIITTTSTILASRKLLTVSTKVTLLRGKQDMKVKKI